MSSDIHSIHPYPCKFPPDIVTKDLHPGQVFLDPFCGSGTSLLEAKRRGLEVIGIDCNPIATLISRVKLSAPLAPDDEALDLLEANLAVERFEKTHELLPDFAGRDHWFSEGAQWGVRAVQRQLALLIDRHVAWDVAAVALSAITNRVSNQDSETRYARVERQWLPGEVIEVYLKKLHSIRLALQERGELSGGIADIRTSDFVDDSDLPDSCVDVIFTSPPYANTMDYYLYHKQRMNVLGFDFKFVQGQEIGSRHEFSSKKAPRDKWHSDYRASLQSMQRVLRDGGRAYVVIGDSQIAGELIAADTMTIEIARALDFSVEVLASEGMAGKSRTFNSRFQRPNKREHVIMLRKK